MTDDPDWTDGVHFGTAVTPPPDPTIPIDDEDPDDEELPETPAAVIAMLGFDPAKEPGFNDPEPAAEDPAGGASKWPST